MKKILVIIFIAIFTYKGNTQNSSMLFQNPCENSEGELIVKEKGVTILLMTLKPKSKFELDIKATELYTYYFRPIDPECVKNSTNGIDVGNTDDDFKLEIGDSVSKTSRYLKNGWRQYYSQRNIKLLCTLNCPVYIKA